MPKSLNYGKDWTKALFKRLNNGKSFEQVLDIGAGKGTYVELLRELSPDTKWTGVEAWQEYADKYNLQKKYDQLIVNDARKIDWEKQNNFDIAILGDMVEHMSKAEGLELLQKLTKICRYIFVSIPVVYFKQEDVGGNPYEKHIKVDWSHAEAMLSLPELWAWYVEGCIGVYLLCPEQSDKNKARKAVSSIDPEIYSRCRTYGCGERNLLSTAGLYLRLLRNRCLGFIAPEKQ